MQLGLEGIIEANAGLPAQPGATIKAVMAGQLEVHKGSRRCSWVSRVQAVEAPSGGEDPDDDGSKWGVPREGPGRGPDGGPSPGAGLPGGPDAGVPEGPGAGVPGGPGAGVPG